MKISERFCIIKPGLYSFNAETASANADATMLSMNDKNGMLLLKKSADLLLIAATKAISLFIKAANANDNVIHTVIKNQSFQISGLLNLASSSTKTVPIKIAAVM